MTSRNFNFPSFLFLVLVPGINLLWIAQTAHLTGDFRSTKILFGIEAPIFFVLFVLVNTMVIAIISRVRVVPVISIKRVNDKLLLTLLVIYLITSLAFGTHTIGGETKVTNPVSLLITKFSVEWLYFILCGTTKKRSTVLMGSFVVLFISLLKTSLFGFLSVTFGVLIFAHARRISSIKIWLSVILVCVLVLFFGNFLVFLYEYRAELRGATITVDSNEVTSLILGRLSSYSSFYFTMLNLSHLKEVSVLEPLIAFIVVFLKLPFNGFGLSPTVAFNQFIGTDGYSIFVSFPAVITILLYQSLTAFLIFLLLFLFLALFMKCLIPYCNSRNIISSCLLIPVLISGSFWEFLILSEKLLFTVLAVHFFSRLTLGRKR